jgi:plasmid maintenance system antidote protein VapI
MKNNETNFDDAIGSAKSPELSKKQHDAIRAARKSLYDNKPMHDKIDNLLDGFRFSVQRNAADDETEESKNFGYYLSDLLTQMNIKRSTFANYIHISPRNINKYLNGERKFNIEHALMLEKIFKINAKTVLALQWNNEIAKAKKNRSLDDLSLNDLLDAQ